MSYVRHSPLHGAMTRLKPVWGSRNGMAVPMRVGSGKSEGPAMAAAGIADVTYLRKLSVKGPGAAAWLRDQGAQPPETMFNVHPLTPSGGMIARTGRNEYFLEAGMAEGATLPILVAATVAPTPDALPTLRHDGSLLIVGPRVPEILAQTCGLNIVDDLPDVMVLTRMAAVSVMLLYRPEVQALRVWCDPSFAVYLWDALIAIAGDFQGGPVGVDAVANLL
jgi:sarcosine oxidase subunit gamma